MHGIDVTATLPGKRDIANAARKGRNKMMKSALGALIAALAMFLWGFAYWGSGVIDPFTHMSAEAETAVGSALTTNFAADGVYFVPDSKVGTEEDWFQRMSAGPVAMINFRQGGTAPMQTTMALGFLHMLITSILLAALLVFVAPASTYAARFRLVAVIGVIAAFFTHLGQPIWWHYPWSYAMVGAAYDAGAYVIAGAILAYFVTPATR